MANNRHFDFAAPLYDRLIPPPDADQLRALLDLLALEGQEAAAGWMLDAGGGTGRVTALLCGQVERLAISDLSRPMLEQARRTGCLLPAQARVERLPFANDAFSRILVMDALHHFTDQSGAVRELARVLRPGGRLVIGEPDIRRFAVKLIALAETLLLMGSRFRTPGWIERLLSAQGLQTRVEHQGATAWVIGLKPERNTGA